MQTVGITEGVAYGLRIMAYYILVVLLGIVTSGVGGAMIFRGWGVIIEKAPDWGTMLVGFIIFIIGLIIILAGVFGALHKIIADSVAKGVTMTSGG